MVNEQRLIETFMELVQVDSESGHEGEICKLLEQKFSELGLKVYVDDTMEQTGHGAGNLFAEWEADEAWSPRCRSSSTPIWIR